MRESATKETKKKTKIVYSMRHPKFQIIQVEETIKGVTKKVVSKELMFKCDAERVVNYKNAHDAITREGYHLYWCVQELLKAV